ncbi:MAG: Signal peptidase I T [Fimbriimonadaceae bacterium]|nr:Signal peptidase I T [Fimbriimonadaceae bacterium]
MSSGTTKRRLFRGFGILLLLVLCGAVFFFVNFKTIEVKGDSMLPIFKNGDRVLITKAYWLVGDIRRNDVVVIEGDEPNEYWIKRVYRMPGEKVNLKFVPYDHQLADGEFIVPEGHYYVLGDNLLVSEDSRNYGPIDADRVVGKVIVIR